MAVAGAERNYINTLKPLRLAWNENLLLIYKTAKSHNLDCHFNDLCMKLDEEYA